MKDFKKIEVGDHYGYPCYPLIDRDFLYYGIRYSDPEGDVNSCSSFELQKFDLNSNELVWSYSLPENLLCNFLFHDQMIILVMESSVVAINSSDHSIIWKLKVKNWNSHVSIIDDHIYLINKNSITTIDLSTGKKQEVKKFRVKWLDSPVVAQEERFFVSTANSKILELDVNTLDIVKEYKYPGSWAIATTPVFFENQIIANSYAGYIIGFDVNTTEALWKVKKQAGREPKHLLDEEGELLFASENLGDYKLSAISLPKGKKRWTQPYHIDQLIMVDKDLLVLAKNDDGQYFLAEINKKNGEINEVHSPSEFQYDERFQYRLWSGAGFAKSAQYLVACYIPNHIYINKC